MEIAKSIVMEASAETIFKALTQADQLTQWFQDEVTFEPYIDGKVIFTTFKDRHPEWNMDRDYTNEGIVLEFIPDRKLSYTWLIKDLPDFPKTTVTWELEEIEPERTKVVITHTGFKGGESGLTSVQSHEEGWTEKLKHLTKYCEKDKVL